MCPPRATGAGTFSALRPVVNRDVPLLGTELPYGQPWDGYDQVDEEREAPEAESEQEGPYIGPYETDPFFEAYDDDDEDDDDLLAALDEALDEVEAEARVEFARGLAFPELDALELIPMADTAYRSAIAVFMGRD